mgnify:CR=1 FL=1
MFLDFGGRFHYKCSCAVRIEPVNLVGGGVIAVPLDARFGGVCVEINDFFKPCIACATLEELLALKPDYLVESASPAAMRELALPALRNGTGDFCGLRIVSFHSSSCPGRNLSRNTSQRIFKL